MYKYITNKQKNNSVEKVNTNVSCWSQKRFNKAS